VPALCSALMILTILTWLLSSGAFFFDAWRIPFSHRDFVGTLTAQSTRSDHFYNLRKRALQRPALRPGPAETIEASKSDRIVVVR